MKVLVRVILLLILTQSISASVIDIDNNKFNYGNDVTSLTSYPLFSNQETIYKINVVGNNSNNIYTIDWNDNFDFNNQQIRIKEEQVKEIKNYNYLLLILIIIFILFMVVFITNQYYINKRRKNDDQSKYYY